MHTQSLCPLPCAALCHLRTLTARSQSPDADPQPCTSRTMGQSKPVFIKTYPDWGVVLFATEGRLIHLCLGLHFNLHY
jgi:hypothetical protein